LKQEAQLSLEKSRQQTNRRAVNCFSAVRFAHITFNNRRTLRMDVVNNFALKISAKPLEIATWLLFTGYKNIRNSSL